jgi:tetratricopeptide (TPR) repeat protein
MSGRVDASGRAGLTFSFMRSPRATIGLLFCVCLVATPSFAQAVDDPHAACTAVGYVPKGLLEKPVGLREGTGAGRGRGQVHDPVTTESAEAQALYDQGVAYLHSYVWIEAARSFRQALRVDPKLALAHLGLSRVATGLEDAQAARSELTQAEALAAGATPRERRRIAVRGVQLEALADLTSVLKHAAYKKALDDALGQDMDDVELWLLRGNAEEATAAGRGQRGGASSVAFYERALAVSPNHLAAHHYLVHSYEQIGRIDDALAHGEVYARMAPAVPHAQHMWAHDLRRVGRTKDAIAQFEKANTLENAYYAAEGIPAELDWHHQHNLDLLATSHEHQGQLREAEALMRQSFALPPPYEYSAFNKKEWPSFLLSRGRAAEAREASRALAASRFPAARAIGHVSLAQVALATGALDEARAEAALAETELAALEPGPWPAREATSPYLDLVKGSLELKSGDRAAGRALFEDVARRVRAIPGPDAWMQALFVLESMARTAREASDSELASGMARQMLEHDPAYAGGHYALGLVAEQRGDTAAAQEAFGAALLLWAEADPDLPELQRLRRAVASR